MTRKLRTSLPLRRVSLHARSRRDDQARPIKVIAHLATPALADLFASGRATEFSLLPACRVYSRDATGSLPVTKSARSGWNSLSTNFERTSKNAAIGQPAMLPSS
jgi:hypothetical protein